MRKYLAPFILVVLFICVVVTPTLKKEKDYTKSNICYYEKD